MTNIYRCDICGAEFPSSYSCRMHEASHLTGEEEIKYMLIHSQEEYLCDYCDNSFYVYGCEEDCNFKDCAVKNNYKYFKPVEPLHNKRTSGGV